MSKRIALGGMLVALAFVFSYIEMLVPLPFGIPGMKLGLANLVVLLCLYSMGAPLAVTVSLVRVLLATFIFGSVSGMLYSLAGAVLSFIGMCLCYRHQHFSPIGVSVLGGVLHNIGQLLVAFALLGMGGVLYYVLPLLCAGAVTGCVIGVVTKILLPHVKQMGGR